LFKRVRYYIFLRDVLGLAVSAFGGPQAHLALFQERLVRRRGYLSEADLLEINALCQVLPGPTSTQTLALIGFRIGGPNLAYLTLLVWMLPAVSIMTLAGVLMANFQAKEIPLDFTRFIQPMAVGFVSYAAYSISLKTVNTRTGLILMVMAAVASFFIRTPFVFPVILLIAGAVTAIKYKKHPKQDKDRFTVNWSNFLLWAGVLVLAAVLGGITRWVPVRLFENFYRNGSLIFGGGQVLTPLLYTEFVEYKKYLTSEEFLSGYALAQSLPGPVFSFSSYVGALAVKGSGLGDQVLAALLSAAGIFLPGTFLAFFVIRIWENLKKFRPVRASLEGVNAAGTGLVAAAAVILFQPLDNTALNFGFTIGTFCLLAFTRLPSYAIILFGLGLGLIL
jgi:chromate transporter